MQNNTQRIAKNTVLLYLRMFVMMIIGLYTSRVILKTLGVEDYGTYNVVGGVVSMFSILTAALSSSISRFLTFELGRGDGERLKRVFSTALNVQILISIIVVIGIEVLGVWFLNTQMDIPEGRMGAANWVLQCSAFTFVVGLLMVPYNASIIAHERLSIYAYVGIWDAIMKLVIVFLLYISPFDRLKSYAVLLLCVSTLTTLFYWFYCKHNFKECNYQRIHDKSLFKDITSYAGWGMIGDGAWILNTQGINILLNLFFGVSLNAARGIATTVDNAVQSFVNNYMVAINPQITKSYAIGDYDYMHKLIVLGSKYSYFLTLLFLIPICMETRQILTLWLSVVPDYAVVFTQLALMASACIAMTKTLTTAIAATGDIRDFELVVCLLYLSIFPITWLAFSLGMPSVSCYVIYLIVVFAMIFVKIRLVARRIHMSESYYIRRVLFKVFGVSVLSIILPLIICFLQPDSPVRLLEVSLVSIVCTLFSIWVVGMDRKERSYLLNELRIRLRKKR